MDRKVTQSIQQGNTSMIASTQLTESIGRGYMTALLLTGNQALAEVSVLAGIANLEPDNWSEAVFLEKIIRATLSQPPETVPEGSIKLAEASCGMPIELQKVLQLPKYLRQCFVLRILVGLPRKKCAHLLNLETHELDRRTCAAAFELASLRSLCVAS